jgi:hypothetical protein
MVWVWLWLVMLDMMVNETWHVPSKVSGRLCSKLGCVSTFGHVVVPTMSFVPSTCRVPTISVLTLALLSILTMLFRRW